MAVSKSWIIALVVVCVACSSLSGGYYWMSTRGAPRRTPALVEMQSVPEPPLLPPPPPTTPSPTPMPTSQPPRSTDIMIYSPGSPYVMYPPGYYGPRYPIPPTPRYPAAWWPPRPRPIQPGGSWPELMNRDKDDAVAYIMSTYPNMTVAAVRYGAPMPSDARQDRFVVVYDAWTRKVVGAQIG